MHRHLSCRRLVGLRIALLCVALGSLVGCSKKITNVTNVGGSTVPDDVVYVANSPDITDHGDPAVAGSFAAVVAALNGRAALVVFAGNHTYKLKTSLSVPTSIRLEFRPGAVISIARRVLLDIHGSISDTDRQLLELQPGGSVYLRGVPFIRPQWFGARGDGTHDDTQAIQKALDCAAELYNIGSFPPTGEYPPPIVVFKPGSYWVSDSLDVYGGLTLMGTGSNPFTNGHTRLIMDFPDKNKDILHITRVFQSHRRTHLATITIQDLEFWYVPPGGTIPDPHGTGYQVGSNGEPIYRGTAISFGEPCNDVRIKRCNFYQCPNGGVGLFNDPTVTEDVSRTRGITLDECEFDTGTDLLWASGVDLDLVINDSKFFSGDAHLLLNSCGGRVSIHDTVFELNARIVANACDFDAFSFTGNVQVPEANASDYRSGRGFLHLDRARVVTITGNSFCKVSESSIHLIQARSGVVSSNVIDNSGVNTAHTLPADDFLEDQVPAAIRLSGCKNVNVIGNTISATAGGAYGGFGIYARDMATSTSEGNLISGNRGSAPYNGAQWRGQGRRINVGASDLVGQNSP